MSELLSNSAQYPLCPILDIVSKDIRDGNIMLNPLSKLLSASRSRPGLAVFLRQFACCTQNEVRDRVVVVRDGSAAEPSDFKRNCTSTGKWIKYTGNIAVVGNLDELSCNTEDLKTLDVFWVGCLPLHK